MFWVRKLKQVEATDSTWIWSYADMVTLLLAVFVMLAAMGDLRTGNERFQKIRGGMQQAFGFASLMPKVPSATADPKVAQGSKAARIKPSRPLTVLERFEQAGFSSRSPGRLIGPDNEELAPCDLLIDGERMILRIAGHASFAENSSTLQPTAERALRRVATFLADGRNRIEVRGHSSRDEGMNTSDPGDPRKSKRSSSRESYESLLSDAWFQADMDLSYARGRAVTTALVRYGVPRERLSITAWGRGGNEGDDKGNNRKGNVDGSEVMLDGADRQIEIVVHAVAAVGTSSD